MTNKYTVSIVALTHCHGDDYFFIEDNLAYRKITKHSNQYSSGAAASSKGVDGNSISSWEAGSCTYSKRWGCLAESGP